jgi:hypothetical protein
VSGDNCSRSGTGIDVHRTFIWLLASGAWGAGLSGALHLQGLPTSAFGAHGVCGPWGCGPPVPVLLACHGFWMVLLGPPAVVAACRLPGRWVRLLGMLLILLGAAGLLGVGLWEAATWFREANWLAAAIRRAALLLCGGHAGRLPHPGSLDRGKRTLVGRSGEVAKIGATCLHSNRRESRRTSGPSGHTGFRLRHRPR